MGENEFSYCNRLRASELESLFGEAGWSVLMTDRNIDERSVAELKSGFPLHKHFRPFECEDLCTTRLDIYAQ